LRIIEESPFLSEVLAERPDLVPGVVELPPTAGMMLGEEAEREM
jgi:hypothetical protein